MDAVSDSSAPQSAGEPTTTFAEDLAAMPAIDSRLGMPKPDRYGTPPMF